MTVEMTGQEVPAVEVEQTAVADTTPQNEEVHTPESEAQTEEPKQDKANPVQKRIDQLSWQRHEAERRYNAEMMERQRVENQYRELQAQHAELVRRATQPRFEQYNDLEQYQRAVEAHSQQFIAQQQEALRREQAAQAQAFAQQQQAQRLNAYVAQGAEKYSDFEQVVNNPALPNLAAVNPAVLEVVLDDPGIAYFLGKNPAEARRIATMDPVRAIAEVGKIAAKLSASPVKASTAPPPPPTVGGNQRASTAPSDTDSMEDWLRKRQAQLKRK